MNTEQTSKNIFMYDLIISGVQNCELKVNNFIASFAFHSNSAWNYKRPGITCKKIPLQKFFRVRHVFEA